MDDTEQHSLRIDTWDRCILYLDTPYLLRCGVLCRLFLIGSFHNLHLDKRISTPHFLLYNLKQYAGVASTIIITIMPQYNVKVVHHSSSIVPQVHNNTIHVTSASYIDNHQDVVWFNNHQYKTIFHKVRSEDKKNKLLAIVRISYNGRSIRRRYLCDQQNVALGNGDLGLTSESVRILFDKKPASANQVTVTKGNLLDAMMYYWDHPFHATRISFKVGMPSLIISIISLVISIIY